MYHYSPLFFFVFSRNENTIYGVNGMSEIEYNGKDCLYVQKGSNNYNNYLFGLINRCSKKGDTVLDFGAGAGTYAVTVAKDHDVVCVETDPTLKKELKEQGLKVTDDIETAQDKSINLLYSFHVLEHIENDEEMIQLWYNKIVPGGKLLVYLPAFNILYSSMDKRVGHYRRYTKKELKTKLERGGFVVTECRYAESVGFAASIYNKFFGHDDGTLSPSLLLAYDKYLFPIGRFFDIFCSPFFGKNVYAIAEKRK